MRTICFYFQVHQPLRLRTYRFFDIGEDHYYYNDYLNKSILKKVAKKSYLPTNKLMLDLINKMDGKFKIAYSLSGTVIEQFEKYAPEVLDSFKALAATGKVEFLAETYSHSLVSLTNEDEFRWQVEKHSNKIEELFGQRPTVFRNTELIYSDSIGEKVANMGFKAMLTEGAKHILGWKSPNYLYFNPNNNKLKLLLRNYKLSDDIAFRFSNQRWDEWPLTSEKFTDWLKQLPKNEEIINLFMDYETFGEHQWKETGIFDFMEKLPEMILSKTKYTFSTPSEVVENLQPVAPLHVPYPISWADEERDLTAWVGNELQDDAFDSLYKIRDLVLQCKDTELEKDWLNLQTSDHFYYMCTKFFSDGDVHSYFNPFDSPYDAYVNYMNVLSDFIQRVEVRAKEIIIPQDLSLEEANELISKHEDAISKLKSIIKKLERPKVIENSKPQRPAIAKTKPKTEAIEKTKPQAKAIEKTKPITNAIEKTKPEVKVIENTKPKAKSIAKTKPETKALPQKEESKETVKKVAKKKTDTKKPTTKK